MSEDLSPEEVNDLFTIGIGCALDNHIEKVDVEKQRQVWAELTKYGVNVDEILRQLSSDQDVTWRLQEQSRAHDRFHWRIVARSYQELTRLINRVQAALRKAGMSEQELESVMTRLRDAQLGLLPKSGFGPDDAVVAESNLVEVRQSIQGLAGPSLRRSRFDRLSPAQFLQATRQRVMPRIRRRLFDLVQPHVEHHLNSRRLEEHPGVDLEHAPAPRINSTTDRLAAELIAAFFPAWGLGTTADNVRSARCASRRQRSASRKNKRCSQ